MGTNALACVLYQWWKTRKFVNDVRYPSIKVIPKEGDYDIADMLFKEARTAMIINGPWS